MVAKTDIKKRSYEFGLINMNERLYDPLLGRMLSPDPYVQNPFFSQDYNRYAYVRNNPLKYTDPTGMTMNPDDDYVWELYLSEVVITPKRSGGGSFPIFWVNEPTNWGRSDDINYTNKGGGSYSGGGNGTGDTGTTTPWDIAATPQQPTTPPALAPIAVVARLPIPYLNQAANATLAAYAIYTAYYWNRQIPPITSGLPRNPTPQLTTSRGPQWQEPINGFNNKLFFQPGSLPPNWYWPVAGAAAAYKIYDMNQKIQPTPLPPPPQDFRPPMLYPKY